MPAALSISRLFHRLNITQLRLRAHISSVTNSPRRPRRHLYTMMLTTSPISSLLFSASGHMAPAHKLDQMPVVDITPARTGM
jgi:hypothetical protein